MKIDMGTRPAWGRIPYDIENRRPWLKAPFPETEYSRRWTALGERLKSRGIGAAVVFAGPGDTGAVRYLTNFESYVGNTAVVVTADGRCAIATNSLMRAEPMQSSIWMTHVQDVRPTAPKRYARNAKPLETLVCEILSDYLGEGGDIATVGTVGKSFVETILDKRPGTRLVEFGDELSALMALKSQSEIDLLRRANELVVDVFSAVRDEIAIGVTETHLAGVAFEAMMAGGSEGPSFSLALVAGARGGLKHALPSDYRMRSGDILFIDFGLLFEGYVTDNARTAIVGKPSRDALDFVRAADAMTEAALAVARPGVAQSELDDAAFAVACERGFRSDYYFRAHGVGTTLFQPPRFTPGSTTPLVQNEIFSVEPMLVRHGFGSACVERTVLISTNGAEVLDVGPGIWIDQD